MPKHPDTADTQDMSTQPESTAAREAREFFERLNHDYVRVHKAKEDLFWSTYMAISDDHAGLKAARQAELTGVPWQRCQFHLQRNASAHVPKIAMRREVARALRSIFNAPDRDEARRRLQLVVESYRKTAPKLAAWMDDNVPEGLTIFEFPEHQRRNLRTTNLLENLNREVRRRTRVATIFPNDASLLRLVSAVLVEVSDGWETDRLYLAMGEER